MTSNSNKSSFLIYCIEIYKKHKNLKGSDVTKLFFDNGIVEFLYEFFDILHTQGDAYIVNEIDKYILNRQGCDLYRKNTIN